MGRDELIRSPAYLNAWDDAAFMHRDELRGIRLQLELRKVEMVQREQGVESTVVM